MDRKNEGNRRISFFHSFAFPPIFSLLIFCFIFQFRILFLPLLLFLLLIISLSRRYQLLQPLCKSEGFFSIMTIIFWHEPAVWKAKCGFDCLEKRAGVMVDWAKWKAGGLGYCIHWKKAFCTDRFQISQNHSTLRLPPQILHPLNDRLSAAALMQEGRFIESDAYFSYG